MGVFSCFSCRNDGVRTTGSVQRCDVACQTVATMEELAHLKDKAMPVSSGMNGSGMLVAAKEGEQLLNAADGESCSFMNAAYRGPGGLPGQAPPSEHSDDEEAQVVAATALAERNRLLHHVFLEFAQFGSRADVTTLDIFRFMKLCRECGLLLRPCDASSIDLVFYKCKEMKTNRMTFKEFKLALVHIASMLEVPVDEVTTAIIASQGPLANNITLPKYVRYHDDRDNWTGTQRQSAVASLSCDAAGTPPLLPSPRQSITPRQSSLPHARPRPKSVPTHTADTIPAAAGPDSWATQHTADRGNDNPTPARMQPKPRAAEHRGPKSAHAQSRPRSANYAVSARGRAAAPKRHIAEASLAQARGAAQPRSVRRDRTPSPSPAQLRGPKSDGRLYGMSVAERLAGTYPSHYLRVPQARSSGFNPTTTVPGSPRGGC